VNLFLRRPIARHSAESDTIPEIVSMNPQESIAHYRIVSKLGEGGMGAVYRATDTKLNREVAIKILPEAFATDHDRMARFTREAQVLASLNHPNIAIIHGVEERALILELVEGPLWLSELRRVRLCWMRRCPSLSRSQRRWSTRTTAA
jgi:serine/threonine protein kinase